MIIQLDQRAAGLRGAPGGFVPGGTSEPAEAADVEAATGRLLAATADLLVRQGTFTRHQATEMIAALERPPAPR